MKQPTLKNLLIVIFCSLSLHTITPNLLYAEDNQKKEDNEVKVELEGNLVGGGSDLSITGKYKFVLSDDSSSMIQYLQSNITLRNIVSNKMINDSIRKSWGKGWGDFGKTFIKEVFKEISVETNPILVLENKELTLKLGLKEVKFGPYKRAVLGGGFALDKLPYNMKFDAGLYLDVLNDYTKFHVPVEFSKKGLVSEEDSLKLNMTIATDGTTYYADHGYLAFAKPFLARLGGVSVAYKTGDKESILNSLDLSCGSVIMGRSTFPNPAEDVVKNKPAATIGVKLNGAPIRDFGFSQLYNMLPEKTKELCGSLDTFNISLTNHFRKKHKGSFIDPIDNTRGDAKYEHQIRAGLLEHVTIGLTATFKDVCQTKDTKLTIGLNVTPLNPNGHNSWFSFVVKFSKTFDII